MHSADRCDRCGAQAYTEWQGPNADPALRPDRADLLPGELGVFSLPVTFCAHHDRALESALRSKRWERTVDDRADLVPA